MYVGRIETFMFLRFCIEMRTLVSVARIGSACLSRDAHMTCFSSVDRMVSCRWPCIDGL